MTVVLVDRFDARYYTQVEQLIGRPLRRAERVIHVLSLDRALNEAKTEVAAAVEEEKARAVRAALRGNGRVRLLLTTGMLDPLDRLFQLGRREAAYELAAAGYPTRRYDEAQPEPHLLNVAAILRKRLRGISVRVQAEYVDLDFQGVGYDAIVKTLLRTPGARDAASRVVSKALTSGLSATFTDAEDIVPRWEYTSVLDGGTCDVCAPLDGTVYESITALFEVLPDFGPNPDCLGEDRCRCRAVPA